MHDSLPQSIRKLLGILENVEKVVANSNAKEKATEESIEKATGKCDKGKCKGTNSHMTIKFPRRQESRKVARCARSMGACI